MATSSNMKYYPTEFEPIRLKQVITSCHISQAKLADEIAAICGRPVSRAAVNLAVNRGYMPRSMKGFQAAVETALGRRACVVEWMAAHGCSMPDLWLPLGHAMRGANPRRGTRKIPAMMPGDPQYINQVEVEMISQEALRHFKVFRNPFIDDITKDSDIYMSDEHRYIEAAMLDSARHSGFLAVIGEVGSGKSVMRRKVIEQLKRDGNTLVIYPQMIDKTRLSAASICDAIILDISSERPRIKLEAKTRQVQRLLMDRAKGGYRHVLIIEEAHDLSTQTLKYLKRFYELEDGYSKLMGIIIIGQSELKHRFDEGQNVDMREVIRRVQVAEIRGLNGNLKEYLTVKFKRVGKAIGDVFAEDAFAALGQRLTSTMRDGKTKISHAYPLMVNNYTARAMNLACELSEPLISADVIMAL